MFIFTDILSAWTDAAQLQVTSKRQMVQLFKIADVPCDLSKYLYYLRKFPSNSETQHNLHCYAEVVLTVGWISTYLFWRTLTVKNIC